MQSEISDYTKDLSNAADRTKCWPSVDVAAPFHDPGSTLTGGEVVEQLQSALITITRIFHLLDAKEKRRMVGEPGSAIFLNEAIKSRGRSAGRGVPS
jgi:hypothetical protein